MMPHTQTETTVPTRPGWTVLQVPALSLSFVGRPPANADHDPLSCYFDDDPQPEGFRHFDLVERAALRALAAGVIAALDIYEDATRDDA